MNFLLSLGGVGGAGGVGKPDALGAGGGLGTATTGMGAGGGVGTRRCIPRGAGGGGGGMVTTAASRRAPIGNCLRLGADFGVVPGASQDSSVLLVQPVSLRSEDGRRSQRQPQLPRGGV